MDGRTGANLGAADASAVVPEGMARAVQRRFQNGEGSLTSSRRRTSVAQTGPVRPRLILTCGPVRPRLILTSHSDAS
jgi:hypothetical protein